MALSDGLEKKIGKIYLLFQMWGKTFLETFSPLKTEPGMTTFIMPFTKCCLIRTTVWQAEAYRSFRRQTSVEPSLRIPNTSGIISPLKLRGQNANL